jgi:hypothetical protein
MIYSGKAATMMGYFEGAGYPCPTFANPAYWIPCKIPLIAGILRLIYVRSTCNTRKEKKNHELVWNSWYLISLSRSKSQITQAKNMLLPLFQHNWVHCSDKRLRFSWSIQFCSNGVIWISNETPILYSRG